MYAVRRGLLPSSGRRHSHGVEEVVGAVLALKVIRGGRGHLSTLASLQRGWLGLAFLNL